MDFLQILVLALVQGITEFLPISSSGHLILVPLLTDWPDQGQLMDVAVHVGTLGAVVVYLMGDLRRMLISLFEWREHKGVLDHPSRKLIALILVATVPVVLAGLIFKDLIGDNLRSLEVIGWTMLGFGIALWAADKWAPKDRPLVQLGFGGALVIGLFQILALIPGTSRAGITMTASRLLGYNRTDSATFSMLLSIPTIFAAGALAGLELYEIGALQLGGAPLIGAALAFVSALLAIWLMMRWLKTASFTPFVIYRVVLGLILLWLAYNPGA